ncbi:DUF4937 domain-containing protein [Celerinatantimonas yamalensis]|uniref:DUF4937 domain-containing protein n=1 Tax=Celerinatantimonas yamalensis TaxID=559956 RepID=A0ABW9G3C6_9GAMM
MIVKFIECIPVPGKERAFSQAQKAWTSVSQCNGFISQYGGWNNKNSHAVILSIWENQRLVNDFMLSMHDSIVESTAQMQTYQQCFVHYLTVEHMISASRCFNLSDIGFIRIADCTLKPHGKPLFINDQLSIWNPTMASCSGMLGGYVAKFNEEPDRYMVVSLWQDQQSHHQYVAHQFKIARHQVNVEAYIENLVGYQIPTIKGWGV